MLEAENPLGEVEPEVLMGKELEAEVPLGEAEGGVHLGEEI